VELKKGYFEKMSLFFCLAMQWMSVGSNVVLDSTDIYCELSEKRNKSCHWGCTFSKGKLFPF